MDTVAMVQVVPSKFSMGVSPQSMENGRSGQSVNELILGVGGLVHMLYKCKI